MSGSESDKSGVNSSFNAKKLNSSKVISDTSFLLFENDAFSQSERTFSILNVPGLV